MENLNQLKQELSNLKGTSDIAEEYIEQFDKFYDSTISSRVNTKLLEELFRDTEQNFRMSKSCKFILNELVDIRNKLQETLDPRQQELLNIYDFLHDKFNDVYALESFVMGFSVSNELKYEQQEH